MTQYLNVEFWLRHVGKSHAQLVEVGAISSARLRRVYPGALQQYCEPETGVNYEFDAETKILQAVLVAIKSRVEGEPEYKGELSYPYDCFTKDAVRKIWNEPIECKGELVVPAIGRIGGWDLYNLAGSGFENIDIIYQYAVDLTVTGIVLALRPSE